MSTKEKLIERFKEQPKDFTWEELVRLFGTFGFAVYNKGKTSGSRVIFIDDEREYIMHKPHPKNIIKEASMRNLLRFFTDNGFITK
ncbi:MAG: type II toxin-antitoxin system HicA family toxin [Bacteroidales bacterium]|nr:type II toxin-antitoxin system HicA family toxin [Bacteroidales bacterium]